VIAATHDHVVHTAPMAFAELIGVVAHGITVEERCSHDLFSVCDEKALTKQT
jgi:hypothetical protein